MTATMKRSDATKQALLRAARDEFAEYGLAGARVDRIAEAAGVNKERIYGLFGSKDKLFDVILIDTLREFMDVVQPLADTEPGEYVGKLFDYHNNNPQLLRLMMWEGLHRGGEAHDIDGWRAQHYERKFDRAIEQFGVDAQHAGHLLLALCGMSNWSLAVPQTTRLLLGAAAENKDATREFMQEFARAAMRSFPPRMKRDARPRSTPVNELTDDFASAVADSSAKVDRAAQRLRDAQAAADAARDELAAALRDAHAEGTSANQLARQVSGTLSRPVVLKLLAE
ncbi:TetR/AcrR family transcriptional regulator [Nocardia iowensis]|nr:TetR family transcriptional regulator [Nocardia iowensis]